MLLAAVALRTIMGGPGVAGFRLVEVALVGVMLVMAALAALLLVRRPENRVGWIFAAAVVLVCVSLFGDSYLRASAARDEWLPGAPWVAWAYASLAPGLWLCIVALLLTFPTGSLPSPRWRPVAGFAGVLYGGTAVVWALLPGPVSDHGVTNPMGWPAAGPLLDVLSNMFWPLNALVVIVAAGSLVVRYRGSSGVERQQLKWLALSGVLILVGGVALFASGAGGDHGSEVKALSTAGSVMFAGGIGSLPVFASLAVLRYRLYDLDRIISRTLSYALLTGIIAAVYALTVFALSSVFATAGGTSQMAVAGATLGAAAVFQPARRRVQAAVDRRFNRARYDVDRTIRIFAEHMREPVDVDDVRSELLRTTIDVVHPRHAHVWVAPRSGR